MSAPRIQRWQGILETMGLGSAHIETSEFSNRRKRKVGDVDAATSHATVGGYAAQLGLETCSITMPALLAMIMASTTDRRLRRVGSGADQSHISAELMVDVAKTFIDAVLATKDVALPTSPRIRVVNGTVDDDALQEAQKALDIGTRSRIAGYVNSHLRRPGKVV